MHFFPCKAPGKLHILRSVHKVENASHTKPLCHRLSSPSLAPRPHHPKPSPPKADVSLDWTSSATPCPFGLVCGSSLSRAKSFRRWTETNGKALLHERGVAGVYPQGRAVASQAVVQALIDSARPIRAEHRSGPKISTICNGRVPRLKLWRAFRGSDAESQGQKVSWKCNLGRASCVAMTNGPPVVAGLNADR